MIVASLFAGLNMETKPSHEGALLRLVRVGTDPGISGWPTLASSSIRKLPNSSSLRSGDGQVMEPVTDENEKDLLLMLDANSGPSDSLPSDLVSSLFFGLISTIGSISE